MASLFFVAGGQAQVDCAGVDGGSALIDDCGDCQQAYIYDFINHVVVTFVDITSEANPGPMEILVYPDDPLNPYWNSGCVAVPGCTDLAACNFSYLATEDDGSCEYTSCLDCAAVLNGSALVDDCGECQQAYLYDFVTHEVTFVDVAADAVAGPTETLILPDDPTNPYWNSNCTDCSGITGGSALVDDCGDCQQAYLYDFVTHEVTFVDVAADAVAGPTETLILPDDPTNPNWNASCSGCMNPAYIEFDPYATIDDDSCTDARVEGCVYENASNYNPLANADDFSCEFAEDACPADMDDDGAVGTTDLLEVLAAFGTACE